MSTKIARTRRWRLLSIVSCCCLIFTTAVNSAEPEVRGASGLQAAAPVALRRWAIISDEHVLKSGLSGLLTAALSALPELELVERDDLDAALLELKLDNLFGSRAGSERLSLGRTLNADVLLLLKRVDRDGASFLQWTIAECSLGCV